jgi:hypothetical protein
VQGKQKLDASRVLRGLIALMVIVIVLGVGFIVTQSILQLFAMPETVAFNKHTAQAGAREFVKELLVEPSTASFGAPSAQLPEETVEELGGEAFTCNGWLDANTNHGERIRARFTCHMHGKEDGAWELVQPVTITEPPDMQGSIVRGSD